MPIQPFLMQKRMAELGRVRLGGERTRGATPQENRVGKKLDAFRFTSASKEILESVAAEYGGEVVPWDGAEDEGYFQVYTDASELEVYFPPIFSDADGTPTVPFSQWMELWSGGSCQRRCDGETEALSAKPCMCDPDKRACTPTTRISFMLPNIRGLGVWRVESKGWNAAAETPGAVAVLVRAATEDQNFIKANLRLEKRTSKKDGQTRKFVVPVIDIVGATLAELAGGELPLAINGPTPAPEKPALPRASVAPANEEFEKEPEPERPPPPPLPTDEPEAEANGTTPLSKSEFDALVEEGGVTRDEVRAAGKTMFPGKSPSRLTQADWGELWAELSKVEVPA